jgi:symplekin
LHDYLTSEACDLQGHELAMHVLYQLHSVSVADSPESTAPASKNYENFFISLVSKKTLF